MSRSPFIEALERGVTAHQAGRLDDVGDGKKETEIDDPSKPDETVSSQEVNHRRRAKRREYLREYARWLWPHRWAVGTVLLLAVLAAGLEMIEPLFMRFIIDRVLLNSELDTASRLTRLHLAGALFVGVIVLTRLVEVFKDYRQRLVNVRVMFRLVGMVTAAETLETRFAGK